MNVPDSVGAGQWLRFALEDLAAGEEALSAGRTRPRHACFLAQQGGEKALKAALIAENVAPPRHHNLDALRNLLPRGWAVHDAFPVLISLTDWASLARYPEEDHEATPEEADEAVSLARGLVECLLPDLRQRGVRYENIDAP